MKVYNLNIDTSKPVNQVMQMQQNSTGLLKLNVTNDGKSISNLSCIVYDGETEVPSTGNGFKIDMGKNEKVVKIEAKSEAIVCTFQKLVQNGSDKRPSQVFFSYMQLPAGTYRQEDLYEGLKKIYYMSETTIGIVLQIYIGADDTNKTNFRIISIQTNGNLWGFHFYDSNNNLLPTDQSIVVTDTVVVGENKSIKPTGAIYDYIPYTLMGENTDYQLDTTIRPSVNAPYDGEYEEPLTEIEVDGVKFVPTTLTIDGVEYKVLAEEQPTPDPEEPVEP